MPVERKCKKCGRLLMAAATALCATCMALPSSPTAPEHHTAVISVAYVEHAEPPHVPEDELTALHERNDQAAYLPPARVSPFVPPRVVRGRSPLRMTGRSYGSPGAPVVVMEED